MSKRQRSEKPSRAGADAGTPTARGKPPGPGFAAQAAMLAAVLAAVTGLAELFGAANLGVALGIGTIAFSIALMYLMLDARGARTPPRARTGGSRTRRRR